MQDIEGHVLFLLEMGKAVVSVIPIRDGKSRGQARSLRVSLSRVVPTVPQVSCAQLIIFSL